MKKLYLDKKNYVHGVFPFLDVTSECTEIQVSNEVYEMLREGKRGYVWFYDTETEEFSLVENFTEDFIRWKRAKLLDGFDKYKTNVLYGIKNEDSATREIVLAWYNKLLDLNPEAIKNVPSVIQYYL